MPQSVVVGLTSHAEKRKSTQLLTSAVQTLNVNILNVISDKNPTFQPCKPRILKKSIFINSENKNCIFTSGHPPLVIISISLWSLNISFESIIEPPHDKTNKMACAPSEDSDQPGHPPSLIRVLAVRMKKAWVLTHWAHSRLWSGCPGWSEFAGHTCHFLVLSSCGSYIRNSFTMLRWIVSGIQNTTVEYEDDQ